jgi:hypothetical protein
MIVNSFAGVPVAFLGPLSLGKRTGINGVLIPAFSPREREHESA